LTDVALVTGGAGGIGRAIVERLSESGYAVISGDVVDDADAHAPASIPIHLDVSSEESVAALADQIGALGDLRAVVNCAGFLRTTRLSDMSFDDVAAMTEVNLIGTMRVCHATVPLLVNPAAIVNIGSIAGAAGSAPGVSAYAASKAGLEGYTRALACELGRTGVRVNLVAPGFILAPMSGLMRETAEAEERIVKRVPLRRLGEVVEIAEVVEFLLSERASYINGVVLPVDGGVLAQ
jgi:NAD(P)-dependent dehydrogenase (short-subunit alcohol dehydrogenase family)